MVSKEQDNTTINEGKTPSEKTLKNGIISVEEYHTLLNDSASSEDQIMERVQYLEAFCRNVIRSELQEYVESIKTKRTAKN